MKFNGIEARLWKTEMKEKQTPTHMYLIWQYIRDSKGRSRGLLVAGRDMMSGLVSIGWSMCNKKDVFDKSVAWMLATSRLVYNRFEEDTVSKGGIPHSIEPELFFFYDRAERYFCKETKNILSNMMDEKNNKVFNKLFSTEVQVKSEGVMKKIPLKNADEYDPGDKSKGR